MSYHVGDTKIYQSDGGVLKDGSVWDLTGVTVTLIFRKPNGTTTTKSATVVSAAAGTVRYTDTTSTLDVAGHWSRTWRFVDSSNSIDLYSDPINFYVASSPE